MTRTYEIVSFHVPKLKHLITEILVTEQFIKSHVQPDYSNINEDVFREKLFEELFNESKKLLINCEHCFHKLTSSTHCENTVN